MGKLAALLHVRLDEMTGPDRETDRRVAVVIGGWERKWDESRSPHKGGWYWKNKAEDWSWTHEDHDTYPPRYSESIDAALKLMDRVLPGWSFILDTRPVEPGRCRARLFSPNTIAAPFDPPTVRGSHAEAYGPTAPLTILKALLSALSDPRATK